MHSGNVIGTLNVNRPVTSETSLEKDINLLSIIGNITAEAVFSALKESEERQNLAEENKRLRDILRQIFPELICNSMEIKDIYEKIRLAPANATVLIRGNSGTGK